MRMRAVVSIALLSLTVLGIARTAQADVLVDNYTGRESEVRTSETETFCWSSFSDGVEWQRLHHRQRTDPYRTNDSKPFTGDQYQG